MFKFYCLNCGCADFYQFLDGYGNQWECSECNTIYKEVYFEDKYGFDWDNGNIEVNEIIDLRNDLECPF